MGRLLFDGYVFIILVKMAILIISDNWSNAPPNKAASEQILRVQTEIAELPTWLEKLFHRIKKQQLL